MLVRARNAAGALAALLLLALAAFPAAVGAQDNSSKATVTVATPDQVPPGTSDIPVSVNVTGASNLAGFQFVLSFDPSILKVVSVDKTDLLGKTGRQIQCGDPTIDPAAVRFFCVTLGLTPPGIDGDGTLAVIHLQSLKGGKSPLQLSTVKLVHPDASTLASTTLNGTLVISSGSGSAFPWWAIAVAAGAVVVVVLVLALVWRRRSAGVTGSGPAPYSSGPSAGS